MKRTIAWLVVTAALAWWGGRGLQLIDDPIRSLVARDPVAGELFAAYERSGLFQGKLHLDVGAVTDAERSAVTESIQALGYQPWQLPIPARPPALVPLISPDAMRARMAPEAMAGRAATIAGLTNMIGGMALFKDDPFGLSEALGERLRPAAVADGPRIVSFLAPATVDYARTERVLDVLAPFGERLPALGTELFAYDNYVTIRSDISRSLMIAVPLTLVVFLAFCRSWRGLVFLAVGSVISYAAGLAAVRLTGGGIYGLVLAFTSTFIGFNNEYLVHLSGLDRARLVRNLPALSSAIGTTFIGFLVLLFSKSEIIRQLAIVSLGGMLGFLVFLLTYRDRLESLHVRIVPVFSMRVRPVGLLFMAATVVAAMALMPRPLLVTDVDTFRLSSARLEAGVKHFEGALGNLGMSRVFAVPIETSLEATANGYGQRHPLAGFPSRSEQVARITLYRQMYPEARAQLIAALETKGIGLALPETPLEIEPVAAQAYADWLASWWPLPISVVAGGRAYLYVDVPAAMNEAALPEGAVPISPRLYYNALLTDLSRDMARLFLIGLAVMTVYLVPLLKSGTSVLACLTPLLVAALVIEIWLIATGRNLNLIHLMAFALVIGLAIDYGAIAVATGFQPEELSKVLLTGLMTLAAFAALLVARHPILHDLGAVVTIGAGAALITALSLRVET